MLVAIDEILRSLYRRQLDAGAITQTAYEMLTEACELAEPAGGQPRPEKEIIDAADSQGADICHTDSFSRRAA